MEHASSNIHILTTANFQKEVLEFTGLAIVDFWAPWCGPCMKMTQTLEAVASQITSLLNVKIGKVNVDNNGTLTKQYGITSIPTLLFIKNGKLVDTRVGACSVDKITELIRKHQ